MYLVKLDNVANVWRTFLMQNYSSTVDSSELSEVKKKKIDVNGNSVCMQEIAHYNRL